MHEMSLVRALFRQADRVRAEHPAARIAAVRIAVGPLAGVEPDLFASAFAVYVGQYYAQDIELIVDQTSLTAECLDCHQVVELVGLRFRCPLCDSAELHLVGGDGLELVSVTLAQPESIVEEVS